MREAGVAKGLFYWYFENKETLFRELAEKIRWQLRRHQADAMALCASADALTQIARAAEASVRFMAEHAQFFALLEVENIEKQFVDVLRRGTDVHAADVGRLISVGISDGLIREEDDSLLSYGVVGMVGYYCHFHRTGRITVPVDELAAFVARSVVRLLAADDSIAGRVERALLDGTQPAQLR